jgi:hypothetical protein
LGAATRSFKRCRHSSDAGTDHSDALYCLRRRIRELVLSRCPWIDQTGDHLVSEVMIEAGLVAGDANVDEVRSAAGDLADEFRISQQRPRHRYEIRMAIGDDPSSVPRKVDAIARRDRDLDDLFQPASRFNERSMRDGSCDRGHGGFMPANAAGNVIGAGCFDFPS